MALPRELDVDPNASFTKEVLDTAFGYLHAQLATVQNFRPEWEEALNDLRQFAFARLDQALVPIYDKLVAIGHLGAIFTSPATSGPEPLAVGIRVFTIPESNRLQFAPAAYLSAQTTANPSDFVAGSLSSYNSTTGRLEILVDLVQGTGTHTEWAIAALPAVTVLTGLARDQTVTAAAQVAANTTAVQADLVEVTGLRNATAADRAAAALALSDTAAARDAAAGSATLAGQHASSIDPAIIVKVDAVQAFTAAQKIRGQTNLGGLATGREVFAAADKLAARRAMRARESAFPNGAMVNRSLGQTRPALTVTDDGAWFLINLVATAGTPQTLETLPSVSTLYPGWSVTFKCDGAPAAFGNGRLDSGNAGAPIFVNGKAQVWSNQPIFYFIGGGEIWNFMTDGTSWFATCLSSPIDRHFYYIRTLSFVSDTQSGAWTAMVGDTTGGTNIQASSPYNLGCYAPCTGLYAAYLRGAFNYSASYSGSYIALGDEAGVGPEQYTGGLTYTALGVQATIYQKTGITRRFQFGEVLQGYYLNSAGSLMTQNGNLFHMHLVSR